MSVKQPISCSWTVIFTSADANLLHKYKQNVEQKYKNKSCFFLISAREYNVIPDDVYLVHDELDKAVGKYNIKYGGSARYR